jgi:hypothetical protein
MQLEVGLKYRIKFLGFLAGVPDESLDIANVVLLLLLGVSSRLVFSKICIFITEGANLIAWLYEDCFIAAILWIKECNSTIGTRHFL